MQKLSYGMQISEEILEPGAKVGHTACLNCDRALSEAYCAYCGQKASTHRYSVKHFVMHDLVHGVWHVDKGLLFTIKGLFTKPGTNVRAFIEGKRILYFNCITLIILVLGAGHFLGALSPVKLTDIVPDNSRAVMSVIEEWSTKYPKFVLLFTIPVSSLFSYLWFRRAKLNGTEHLVLNTYKAAAELVIGLLFTAITIVYHNNKEVLYLLYSFFGLLTMLYSVWFYYQYFSYSGYKRYSLLLRSLMVPVSITFFYLLIGLLVGMVAGVMAHKGLR